jgi:hypothetical protein
VIDAIVDLTAPGDVALDEWARFVGMSLPIMLVVAIGLFALYALNYYRSFRIKHPDDVFRQARPWLLCLLAAVVLQVLLCLITGLAVVSTRTFASVFSMVFVIGLPEGVIGAALFWFFSFVSAAFGWLPPRAKYIPWPIHLFVRRLTAGAYPNAGRKA